MGDRAAGREAGQREQTGRPGAGRGDGPPLLRVALGRVLRRARLAQGRTLADVAGAARVSVPYLSELERGRKEASSEVLAAVSAALHLGLADLLAEAGRVLAAAPARTTGFTIVRLGSLAAPEGPGAPARPRSPRPGEAQSLLAA